MVYGCKTTARVTAKKYCTLAKLTAAEFKIVTTQVPRLHEALQIGIYDYDDSYLRYIK
jgi:hypothetical protein